MAKWIECFKAGTYTDMNGLTHTYTEEDLDTIVAKYQASLAENPNGSSKVPIVKGHPETDDPAQGWVEDVKREGVSLFALVEPVQTFADEVNEGLYKNVSVSLTEDLALKHIGFLGAVAPAVKGMEPVSFSCYSTEKKIVFNFAEPIQTPQNPTNPTDLNNPQPDSGITIEAAQKAQEERAKLYGISVKDKFGSIVKPAPYENIPDEQFGDPVNYVYPINDLPNLLATFATWSNWDDNYTKIERQVVMARIYGAAETLGLKVAPEEVRLYSESSESNRMNYLEIPIDKLSKNQLTEYIVSNLPQSQNNESKFANNLGTNMTNEEWIQKLIEYLVAQATARTNADEGAKIQADFEQFKVDNPMPTGTATDSNAPTDGSSASGTPTPAFAERDPEKIKLMERVKALELKDRLNGFREYATEQTKVGTLLPNQLELAIASLEFAHSHSEGVFSFSESGKTTSAKGIDIIKRLIESNPKHDLTRDFAAAQGNKSDNKAYSSNNVIADPARTEQDAQIRAIMKADNISYSEALTKTINGGN